VFFIGGGERLERVYIYCKRQFVIKNISDFKLLYSIFKFLHLYIFNWIDFGVQCDSDCIDSD
jgi:hypothetical protein